MQRNGNGRLEAKAEGTVKQKGVQSAGCDDDDGQTETGGPCATKDEGRQNEEEQHCCPVLRLGHRRGE